MSAPDLLLYAIVGMALAIPGVPLLRAAARSTLGRRVRRSLPGSGWRPVFLKPHRPAGS